MEKTKVSEYVEQYQKEKYAYQLYFIISDIEDCLDFYFSDNQWNEIAYVLRTNNVTFKD